MECRICNGHALKIFDTIVLKKYNVSYFKCPSCEFIQTEAPFWLNEAYESVITSLDIGLVGRNINATPLVSSLIKLLFDRNKTFLDYGGGYGMLVRMMRDAGMDFYRQDLYCENLFAKNFDISDIPDKRSFELLTAFEVFEHLPDPITEFKKMLEYSDTIFFSTAIYPKNTDLRQWWYLIPDTGQHVSLYSKKTLEYVAAQFEMNYYSYGKSYHVITRKKLSAAKLFLALNPTFSRLYNKLDVSKSLLYKDFSYVSGGVHLS